MIQMIVRRDLLVMSRIRLLFWLLLSVDIAVIIGLLTYNFSGYLPWQSSQIQWLLRNTLVTMIFIVLALVFPHVQHLLTQYFSR